MTLELKLDELAERAGVSARTVRYYVQRGLLPAPPFRGRDTVYGAEHLLRLRAIRSLQSRYLPLDAIEAVLARCTSEQLERLTAGHSVDDVLSDQSPEAPSKARGEANDDEASDDEASDEANLSEAGAEAWRRWELAPGLELHLRQGARAEVEALAARLIEVARGQGKGTTRRTKR